MGVPAGSAGGGQAGSGAGTSSGGTSGGGTSGGGATGGLPGGGAPSHGAASGGGGEGNAGITGSGAAGAGGVSGGAGSGSTLPLPALRIYSDTTTVEFTPALLAADEFYAGEASVNTGGVGDLFDDTAADLATNADTRMLTVSADNPNLRIIFTVTETFYRILARRDAVTSLAGLAGKRVATLAGTSANYYVFSLLSSVGLSVGSGSADVELVFGSLSNLPNMLSNGEVDAVSIWEPAMQRSVNALADNGIEFEFMDKEANYREMVNLYTTAEKLADPEMRRGIVAFVRALIQAAEVFSNDPESVYPLVAEAMEVDEALVAEFFPHERFPGRLTPNLLDLIVEEELWSADTQNREPRTREQLATMIDTSVFEEAIAGR